MYQISKSKNSFLSTPNRRCRIVRMIFSLMSLLFLSQINASAQPADYIQLMTIRQPYHNYNATRMQERKKAYQKVNGFMISESQKYLVIGYAYNPTSIAVYEIGTWNLKGVYKVMGAGVELNSSYFAEDDKVLYVKYDRYSTKYKKIDFKTGYIRKTPCKNTPLGCIYEEVKQDAKQAYTKNKKYYVEVSPYDPSDVNVYLKKIK